MNCSGAFNERYLSESLNLLDSAAKKSIIVESNEEVDIIAYKAKLRETLVDCYTSMVHGISTHNASDVLTNYIDSIFVFLQKCCASEIRPSQKILKDILGLVGDMADVLGRRIATHVQTPFVSQMVEHFL